MAFGKRVKLSFDGQDYETQVTLDVIAEMEQRVNLLKLAQSLATGDVKMSHVAIVFASLLRSAGAKVTDDDVWQAMFGDGAADVVSAATIALSCVFPETKTVGGASVGKPQTATRGKKSIK